MIRFLKSFLYAWKGIKVSLAQQVNLKVQLLVALITVGAGFYFNISTIEWCIVLLCISLVLGLEMLNCAIEDVVNLVTTEWKPLAGKIKDMAAGAVLVVSVATGIIGILIFKKYIF